MLIILWQNRSNPVRGDKNLIDNGADDRPQPGRRLFSRLLILSWLVLFACPAVLLLTYPALAGQKPLIKSYDIENSVYRACATADSLIAQHDYTKAINLLLPAVANDPTSYSSHLHMQLAQCYDGLKQPAKAVTEGELALQFDPNDRQAMYNLATFCNQAGKYDQAIRLLKQVLKVSDDPRFAAQVKDTIKDITIYKNVEQANKCMKTGRNTDARDYLQSAAALDPSTFSGCIHGNLSYVLERTGHPEDAISEGKKALRFDSSEKGTVYSIGIAYQDLGKFDDAISWLRRYVTMETDPALKAKAENFIQELADDRTKLDPAANSKADYLDQLEANEAVQKWPREAMPIKVFISPAKNISGYRPVFRPFIVRSFNTWCDVSGKKLSYKIVDNSDKADIQVLWTRDPLTMDESGRVRQKAGLTAISCDNAKLLKHAVVRIRTVNGFDPSKEITDGEAATVSMHEIGHALGIGHSTNCSDIMYFGSSSKQTGFPSARDKATIARLYKDYPVTDFKEAPAVVPADIQYLPPPAFQPPVPTNTDKLPPPMFVPPPTKTEKEKLQPPVFVPPPLVKKSSEKAPPPIFMPLPK